MQARTKTLTLMNSSKVSLKNCNFSKGTLIPNFMYMLQTILGDLAALMIRVFARLPFAMVATSFVAAKRTVVAYKVIFSTNHAILPSGAVSFSGLLIWIRSPMSKGFRTVTSNTP